MRLKNQPNLLLAIFAFIGILNCQLSKAQNIVISANPNTSQNIVTGNSNYHVSESIYLDSEIGSSNFVTANQPLNYIAINVLTSGLPILYGKFAIYLKNVPATTTTFTTGSYDKTGYTKVYGDSRYITNSQWQAFPLLTPFVRTPGTNLAVMFERLDGVARTSPITFVASTGNSNSIAATTARHWNSVDSPLAGISYLSASSYRPNIQFAFIPTNDVAVRTILLPTSSCFSTPQKVRVVISNAGTSTPITQGNATVKLTVFGPNGSIQNLTNTHWIDPGFTDTIDFPTVNLSAVGYNPIRARVFFNGDQNEANDSLTFFNYTTPVTNTFPVIETAENVPSDHIAYTKVLSGSYTWRKQTGKIKNPELTDSLAPHSGNKFFYFNAYAIDGSDEILHSECLNLPAAGPNGNNYYVSFWMSHDTSYSSGPYIFYDSLYLVISTDKAKTWTRLAGYRRNNPSFTLPGWQNHQYDLPNYAGQNIQLGFEGVSKFGNIIGLDDITIVAESSLPVKLISFAGERTGAANRLFWTTASETNNKGFELQRSIDGTNFSALSFVATKSDNGNSNTQLNYDFTDNNPFATTNYYRLKQTDKDGKFIYSNVVLLKGGRNNGALTISSLYPNPAVNNLKLAIASPTNSKVTMVITDLAGKIVLQQPATLTIGDNTMNLNIKQLSKGAYSIKVLCADGCNSAAVRFIK